MADEPRPDGGGSKTHRRTRTAEVADAVSEGTARIAKLQPQQILSVVAIISLGFICSLQAFQVYSEREERKQLVVITVLFAAATRMRFEAGEREKDRAAIAALATKLADLERAVKKQE